MNEESDTEVVDQTVVDEAEVVSPGESQTVETVPKHRFLAAIESANQKYENLKREFDDLKSATAKPAPQKEPTRAELLAAVKEGLISQEQADAVWEQQIIKKATENSVAGAKQATTADQLASKVNEQLAGYREFVPEAWIDGSDQRRKVESEYRYLVSLGHPSSTATEAAAMRLAFGDLSAIKLAKSAKPGAKESHKDVGGGKPSGKDDSGSDVVKGLDARKREYYADGIKKGRYKDWNAVREELSFVRK